MRYILFILSILFLQGDCRKNPILPLDKISIEGFILRDNLGNQMGVNGSAGDDWKLRDWSQFSAAERGYLDFTENIDMSNTAVTIINEPIAYPNPFTTVGALSFYAADSVKAKLAVVNSSGQVLQSYAFKFKGYKNIALNFSDINTYPLGIGLRYYFSFSAAAQQNFKAGYGDVKKCKASSFSNPNECF